jgi:hypothetical protein
MYEWNIYQLMLSRKVINNKKSRCIAAIKLISDFENKYPSFLLLLFCHLLLKPLLWLVELLNQLRIQAGCPLTTDNKKIQ